MTIAAGQAPVIPNPGFADPGRESQRVFRALLDALAHPGRSYPLEGPAQPPAVLGRGLAAIALTVLDEDSTVWLGGALGQDAETVAWLAFHTGASIVTEPDAADFGFAEPGALPALDAFRLGTDEAPHLSTTVVVDVRGTEPGPPAGERRFLATGPGIDGQAELDAPWAGGIPGFAQQWRANGALFPRGVDLVLSREAAVAALPRTTRLESGEA